MTEEDYPLLYRAANDASMNAQSAYLRCIKVYAVVSIIGAGLAVYGIESVELSILAAVLFSIGLGLSVLMTVKKYENIWYRSRAVAESIKTASWRFMMCAEPFGSATPGIDKKNFLTLLRNVLKEHQGLGHDFAGSTAEGEQITQAMTKARSLPLQDRMQLYREHRINEQRAWYTKKSKTNRKLGERWFWIFIGLQAGAILCTILRIGYPHVKLWPTELFIVAGSIAFSWIQLKRFRELAAAYNLTAQEISLASAQLDDTGSDTAFSDFVGDTENAFSREHTQWVARKDVWT